MKAKLHNQYPKNGQMVFVYKITSASKEEREEYENAQGDNFRVTENNEPLFFTNRYVGENTEIKMTSNGRPVADDELGEKLKNLFNRYGKDVGLIMAQAHGLLQPPAADAP